VTLYDIPIIASWLAGKEISFCIIVTALVQIVRLLIIKMLKIKLTDLFRKQQRYEQETISHQALLKSNHSTLLHSLLF
jgi:hypothetical protein